MTIFRPRALLGVCSAAILIAVVPFGGRQIAELRVLDRIGGAPAAVSGAAAEYVRP